MPYLRAKAQEQYEILGGGIDPDLFDEDRPSRSRSAVDNGVSWHVIAANSKLTLQQSTTQRLKALYKKTYPWLNMGFEIWMMCYNIAYLFDRTAFYRPWLSWIGVDLRRLGPEDMVTTIAYHLV